MPRSPPCSQSPSARDVAPQPGTAAGCALSLDQGPTIVTGHLRRVKNDRVRPASVGEDDLHAFVDGTARSGPPRPRRGVAAAHPEAAARVAADRRCGNACGRASRPWRTSRSPPACASRTSQARAGAPPARVAERRGGGAPARTRRCGRGGSGAAPCRFAPAEPMTQAAVSAFRTYVVEAAHPVEVRADGSTDLVRWLSARLADPSPCRTCGAGLPADGRAPAPRRRRAGGDADVRRRPGHPPDPLQPAPGRPAGAACSATPAPTTWPPSRGSTPGCPTW